LTSSNISDLVDDWYVRFISIPQEDLYHLILAANYMDIKPLLDLGCSYIATMIKDKSMDEIRNTFNIANEMTPEEEKALREDPKNKWAEEE
jgi:S-phase kinase-associated protein 1